MPGLFSELQNEIKSLCRKRAIVADKGRAQRTRA